MGVRHTSHGILTTSLLHPSTLCYLAELGLVQQGGGGLAGGGGVRREGERQEDMGDTCVRVEGLFNVIAN